MLIEQIDSTDALFDQKVHQTNSSECVWDASPSFSDVTIDSKKRKHLKVHVL